MSGERILIVDDEAHIVELVRLYLEREGFRVEGAADGAQGLQLNRELRPAMLILDLMLPEVDGLEVCRQVRAESDVPIVMLTARDEDIDKIVGLELGADDYLTKPFNPRELVARVKAILRRTEAPQRPEGKVLHLGDVTIDPARREVTVAGQPIALRAKEFDLLLAFAEHKGMVLSREQLLSRVWGYDFYGETRTVDVHVAHLRKRIAGSAGVRIVTLTGVGYKLVV
jgi:DNA-binding response OmpR family regulator